MALKVRNQSVAEMTVCLLLRIERHAPAEEVDWLLPNSELTDGAYDPRAREAIHDF
jgi:hypothetical protein